MNALPLGEDRGRSTPAWQAGIHKEPWHHVQATKFFFFFKLQAVHENWIALWQGAALHTIMITAAHSSTLDLCTACTPKQTQAVSWLPLCWMSDVIKSGLGWTVAMCRLQTWPYSGLLLLTWQHLTWNLILSFFFCFFFKCVDYSVVKHTPPFARFSLFVCFLHWVVSISCPFCCSLTLSRRERVSSWKRKDRWGSRDLHAPTWWLHVLPGQ